MNPHGIINFSKLIKKFERLDGLHFLHNQRTQQTVRCFIAMQSADNADITEFFAQPVIKSLEIYTFPEIDLQNGDVLTASKQNLAGQQIAQWSGLCGQPHVFQPFQVVR